jgi:hypothetical protein
LQLQTYMGRADAPDRRLTDSQLRTRLQVIRK